MIFSLYHVRVCLLSLNPLHPKMKIEFSSKLILCDHVRNSHDLSVLPSIDITRRNWMLITLRA